MRAFTSFVMCAVIFAMCAGKKTETSTSPDVSGWDVTISGKVANPQTGQIILRELRPDRPGKEEVITLNKDNTFEKKVHLTEPGYYELNFYKRQMLNVILNKSNLTVNADGSRQEGPYEVLGSPEFEVIRKVHMIMEENESSAAVNDLKTEFSKASQANNAARARELQEQYMALNRQATDKVAAFLKQQPASLALVELLSPGNILTRDDYEDVFADAAGKLQKEIPNSVFVKPFLEQYEKSKATAVGSVAPEIALPDPTGAIVKLSSLRGKYVLVDFWAKWCGPCRRENPNVVKAYHKFKAKGFEVFGVSLDKEKADWVRAINDDGLVWTQVSDLKYFESQAAKDYSINAIPFSILLDPNGIILAKNLRGAALERKLAEVLK